MPRRSAGFLIPDMIFAMAILGILLSLFAVALRWQQVSAVHFADTRAAARDAERVLLELHQGITPAPQSDTSDRITFGPLPGGQPVVGYAWVRVTVLRHGRTASLIGLAKATAAEGK